jgi:chaperone BCS1
MLQSMGNNNNGNIILQTIVQTIMLFLMSILEELKSIWGILIEKYKKKYITNPMDNIVTKQINNKFEDSILLDHKHNINIVHMTRVYEFKDTKEYEKYKRMNNIVDAILNKVSNLHNTPLLELIANADFLVTFKEQQIQIEKDLYMSINEYSKSSLCDITTINISISSDKLSTKEIKEYILDIYKEHKITIENGLADKIYYFEQTNNRSLQMNDPRGFIDPRDSRSNEDRKREMYKREILNAPKELSFCMKEFSSNKTFDNTFGDHITKIKNSIDFFENNKEWYKKKGVVHHLGLLFYGLPGCGKTATIKSIANFTKRHVFNINFKNIKTITQFKNLFNNENINVYNNNNNNNNEVHQLSIPINKRLYVLEEIDAISNIVKQRTTLDTIDNEQEIEDELTLGEILTLLDGTMENPGRMFIITSNHPENIDKALLRPGRIDLLVHFDKSTRSDFLAMYHNFYDNHFDEQLASQIPDKQLTFAEFQQILLKHLNNPDNQLDIIQDSLIQAQLNNNQKTDSTKTTEEIIQTQPQTSDKIHIKEILSTDLNELNMQSNTLDLSNDLNEQTHTSGATYDNKDIIVVENGKVYIKKTNLNEQNLKIENTGNALEERSKNNPKIPLDASTLSERYRDEAEELNKSNHIKPYNQLTPINKDGVIPYETSLELHEFKQ